jgi:hypothetical protein
MTVMHPGHQMRVMWIMIKVGMGIDRKQKIEKIRLLLWIISKPINRKQKRRWIIINGEIYRIRWEKVTIIRKKGIKQ